MKRDATKWKDFVKAAQAPGFAPSPLYFSSMMPKSTRDSVQKDWAPGSYMDSLLARQQGAMARGVAKGLKESVPGFVDFTVGNISGLLNGAARSLSGGAFLDGYDESRDFVEKYMSNPIRRAEMSAGGNLIKQVLDSSNRYHEENIEKSLGPQYDGQGKVAKNWSDYARLNNGLGLGESMASLASNFAVTGPMFAKAPKLSLMSLGTQLGVDAYKTERDSERIDKKEEYLRRIEAERKPKNGEI